MKTLIVVSLLGLLIYLCLYLTVMLPITMIIAPVKYEPVKPLNPPAEVEIAIDRNYSSGITKDLYTDDAHNYASLRNSHLAIDLPSGHLLFYNVEDYVGNRVFFTDKKAVLVNFGIAATPDLSEAVEELKVEINKFRRFDLESVSECEVKLNSILNLNNEPQTMRHRFEVCTIEVEPGIYLSTNISTIHTKKENNYAPQWILELTFQTGKCRPDKICDRSKV